MNLFHSILLILIFASCSVSSEIKRIKFRYFEGVKSHKVTMQVPNEFNLTKISTGGEGQEHRYWYSDSSLIYISDARGSTTVNERFIRMQDGAYSRRFQTDSIILMGTNENGNYWQEVKYKGIHYGYSNVPPEKKQLYDNAMLSIKFR